MMKLCLLFIKQLLQDIEHEGKARHDFNPFTSCCTQVWNLQKFDWIKLKSPEEYQRVLNRFLVDPSELLKRELREGADKEKVKAEPNIAKPKLKVKAEVATATV